MFIKNFKFTYYYPPRPQLATISILDTYSELDNWVAELKMNGTNCEIKKQNGKYEFWDRHHNLLMYNKKVIPEVIDELNELEIPDNSIINVELCNDKTKLTKHLLFFHTIFVIKNELLHDVKYKVQREILNEMFKDRKFKHLTLANHYRKNFRETFFRYTMEGYDRDKDLVEGLVIKNLDEKIKIYSHSSSNFGFKIRKQSKKYAV